MIKTETSKCMCKVCEYGDQVRKHLDAIPDEVSRKFFENMYENMCQAEDDVSYYKMKIDAGELFWLTAAEQVMLKIMMSAEDREK